MAHVNSKGTTALRALVGPLKGDPRPSKRASSSLAQTLAKMLRHEHTVVHDPDGEPVHLSYTPDERPVRYFVLDTESGAPTRYYSDPKRAAADFIRTVGTRNAALAAREAQADARAWTQHRLLRNRSMKS